MMRLTFSIGFDSVDAFISHWSSKYDDASESKYEKNIGHPLTTQSRLDLFEWKNGSVIAAKKLKSIETHYPLEFNGRVEERYLQPGRGGGAIWNIFYAHCLYPDKWPIFDQHVCRAMWYMLKGEVNDYQSIANISLSTAQRDLQKLVRDGILSKEGKGKNTLYIINNGNYQFGA